MVRYNKISSWSGGHRGRNEERKKFAGIMLLVLALACLYVGAEGLLAIRPTAAEFSGLAETDAPANGGTKKKSCGKRKKRLTPHRRYGIVSITYERRAFFLCAFFAFYAQRGKALSVGRQKAPAASGRPIIRRCR